MPEWEIPRNKPVSGAAKIKLGWRCISSLCSETGGKPGVRCSRDVDRCPTGTPHPSATSGDGHRRPKLPSCLTSLSSHCLFLNPARYRTFQKTVTSDSPLMAVSDYQQPGPVGLPGKRKSVFSVAAALLWSLTHSHIPTFTDSLIPQTRSDHLPWPSTALRPAI